MSIAPISAVRVTGIQPVMPADPADAYEDGLDVETVTEVVPVGQPDEVAAASEASDVQADVDQNPFARAAALAPTQAVTPPPLSSPAPSPRDPRGGNARMATGFDPTPVMDVAPAPASRSFDSPLARALSTFAR